MENVPVTLSFGFGLITSLTIWLLYEASRRCSRTLLVLLAWLLVQGILAGSGFYLVVNTLPPRLLFAVVPPLLVIATLFSTARGSVYLDSLRPDLLTFLHIVRIPVELVLYALFIHGTMPELMTFRGRNWDILAGLSARFAYYLVFRKHLLGPRAILSWNAVCLALLVNVVANGVLSAPSVIQHFAFDQPSIAVLHFPFVWLPACIVPVMLLAHLAVGRQLLAKQAVTARHPSVVSN